MPEPLNPRLLDQCVEGCAQSHQRLLELSDSLSHEEHEAPSRLPGWSRKILLGHLALNALSHVHLLESASRGEHAEQYPGGPVARQNAIDEVAGWSPEDTVATLRRAVYTLEGAWAGANFDTWNGTGTAASGSALVMHQLPFLRWREVTIHLTDLDVGVEYSEWPDLYVRLELDRQKMAWAASHPMGLTQFPQNVMALPEKQRLAWLVQREQIDGLPKGPGL